MRVCIDIVQIECNIDIIYSAHVNPVPLSTQYYAYKIAFNHYMYIHYVNQYFQSIYTVKPL